MLRIATSRIIAGSLTSGVDRRQAINAGLGLSSDQCATVAKETGHYVIKKGDGLKAVPFLVRVKPDTTTDYYDCYAPVSGSPIRGPKASSGSTKYSMSRSNSSSSSLGCGGAGGGGGSSGGICTCR
jgi:hypothetical protein